MNFIGIIFIIYLILLISVGIWTFSLNKTHEDYLLAGRKLGPWVVAFSERASGESAWLLLALPGAAITVGLSESWAVLGIIMGIIASWFLIAEKLREETESYGALTIPQFLHLRYNDNSNIIRLFSSFIIAFFFLFYVSAQFHASGKVLNSLFDLDPIFGITIGAIVIIVYTLMGGFLAVAWTDLIQGFLMIGTLIVLPLTGIIELINMDRTIKDGLEIADSIYNNNNTSFFMGQSGLDAVIVIFGGLSWGLGYLGQPHLLIRYMAIRSSREIKIARKIAIAWAIPGISGAFFIGIIAAAYFQLKLEHIDPEQAMPMLASQLLHPIIAGLFISGAVAAMMSTADSQLLVSTSVITEDLLNRYFNINFTEKGLVMLSRAMIILMGFIAYGIALYSEVNGRNIFSVVSYAWSGLGSAFGPALLMTFWWKKTTRTGIIAGMATGFLTTVLWVNISILNNLVTERLSSFLFAMVAIYWVSKRKK